MPFMTVPYCVSWPTHSRYRISVPRVEHITEVHVDQGISGFLKAKLQHNYQETLATVHIDHAAVDELLV